MDFQDDAMEFIEQAKEDKGLRLSFLYAYCGDVIYDIYKAQQKTEEIDSLIMLLIDFFELEAQTIEEPTYQDPEELKKKCINLKEKYHREFDQKLPEVRNFISFIDELYMEEPEIKPQIDLLRSKRERLRHKVMFPNAMRCS